MSIPPSDQPQKPDLNSTGSKIVGFKQTFDALKRKIESPEFRQLNEFGRKQARLLIGIDQKLAELEQGLRQEWRRLLDDSRREVRDPFIEEDPFEQALQVATLYTSQRQLQDPAPLSVVANVALGLQALGDGDYDQALEQLHSASQAEIEKQRHLLARQWLDEALGRMENQPVREPAASAEIKQLLERVRRVGIQELRDQANAALKRLAPPPSSSFIGALSMPGVVAGMIGGVLLVAIAVLALLWPRFFPSGQATSTPTPATAVIAITESPVPTLSPTPSASPTPVPINVSRISPSDLLLNTQVTTTLSLQLFGTGLDQLTDARIKLLPQGGNPLTFTIILKTPDQINLEVKAPPAIRQLTLMQVQIDDNSVKSVNLRSGEPEYPVKGVLDYFYTGVILSDAQGNYTPLYNDSTTASAQVGKLRQGDFVRVNEQASNGWFHVLVIDALGGNPTGAAGWVQPWLVLNSGVPERPTPTPVPTRPKPTLTHTPNPTATPTNTPTPTDTPTPEGNPTSRTFGVSASRTSDITGNDVGGACVVVMVNGKDGPIKGAVGNVNKGSANPPTWTTDASGMAQVCSLGRGEWSTVLHYIPGDLKLSKEVSTQFPLSGADGEVVTVTFQEQ